jgi:hypothetical protein
MTHEWRSRRDFLGLAGAGIAAALGDFTLTGQAQGADSVTGGKTVYQA